MKVLPVKIALRYLVAKKSHTAVSVISFISVAAVAVTAMAMICVMSVFNGFRGLIDSKLSELEPDLKVSAADGHPIADADSLARAVGKVAGVAAAVPTVTGDALVIYGNRQIPVTLKGVTGDYDRVTGLKSLIKDGGEFLLTDGSDDYCVMSVGAAAALEASPGYDPTCFIYAPKRVGVVNVANPASAFRRVPTYVAGVFEVRQGEYDRNYVFTSLSAVRRLYDYTEEAGAVEVALADGADEDAVMKAVAAVVGDGYKIENRLMQHSQSLKMVNMEKWISTLLLLLILVVASFNVVSTLAILIIEKTGSIATLHALGADNRTIGRVFVVEGWLVSIAGAVAGLVAGIGLCLLQRQFGLIRLSADTSNLIVDAYPVAVSAADVCLVFAVVAAVGLAASFATVRAMRGYIRR